MPPILDVAIGTVFIFLLFSLVISALNEYILSLTDQRAKFLRLGLVEMLGKGPQSGEIIPGDWGTLGDWLRRLFNTLLGFLKWLGISLATGGGLIQWFKDDTIYVNGEKILEHGLLKSFSRSDSGSDAPSYIPSGAFVTVLLDLIVGPNTPVTNSAAEAAIVTRVLGVIQGAKPAVGVALNYATYDAALAGLSGLIAPLTPGAGTPLKELQDRVAFERTRAQAQDDLLAAAVTNLALAQPFIDQPVFVAVKAQLDGLVKAAGVDFAAFQSSVRSWFSLSDSLARLEAAALGTAMRLLATTGELTAEAIEAKLNKLPDTQLQETLLSLFHSAGRDVKQFKLAIEGWFNSAMDRVSGWYKRFAQKWMIVFGVILASVFNVDTIRIVRELSQNPNLSKAVAAQAAAFTKEYRPQKTWEQLKQDFEEKLEPEQELLDKSKTAEDAATKADPIDKVVLARAQSDRQKAQTALDTKKEKLLAGAGDAAQAQFSTSVDDLRKTGIPMGWHDSIQATELGLDVIGNPNGLHGSAWLLYYPWVYTANFFSHFPKFLPLIGGWFLTAIAASLGAPFWFDLLGRFVNIRTAGKAPGEKDTTSSPTRPPPASLDTTPGTHASAR